MPNWCNNVVILKHNDPVLLKRAFDAINNNRLINEFATSDEIDAESTCGGLRDIVDGNATLETDTITCNFDSAWDAPDTTYEHLLSNGFYVEAYFYESGMAFTGTWINGHVDTWDSDDAPDFLDRMFEITENAEE